MGEKYEVYKNNEHDCIHWNIYAGCSQEQPKKKLHLLYKRKQRYQRRRTGRKQQEQEINEELQAIQTNEQVEHKQEEVSSEEKKEETTPVRQLSNQCKIMNKSRG